MIANKENNYLYNPKLKERARYLRANGTKAEAYLWKFVLKNKLLGYKFFRQRPILNYIVDFMSPELMLIIKLLQLIRRQCPLEGTYRGELGLSRSISGRLTGVSL